MVVYTRPERSLVGAFQDFISSLVVRTRSWTGLEDKRYEEALHRTTFNRHYTVGELVGLGMYTGLFEPQIFQSQAHSIVVGGCVVALVGCVAYTLSGARRRKRERELHFQYLTHA